MGKDLQMTTRLSLTLIAALATMTNVAFAQETEVGSKQFDNGGVYEGSFRNGLQHGTGTFRMPNGYEYTGDWVDGQIIGQGVARFPNGSI